MVKKCSFCWETFDVKFFDVIDFPGEITIGSHHICHTSDGEFNYTEIYYNGLEPEIALNICKISAVGYISMKISCLNELKHKIQDMI